MTSYLFWYNDRNKEYYDFYLSSVEFKDDYITGYVENGTWTFCMKDNVIKCLDDNFERHTFKIECYFMEPIPPDFKCDWMKIN
jgi:hypothetical protein